jgi:hypothetical protein
MLKFYSKIFFSLIVLSNSTYGCEREVNYILNGEALVLKQKFVEGGLELTILHKNKELKFFDSIVVFSEDSLFAFICPLNNGNWPEKPFDILDLSNMEVKYIDLGYIPMDEISCSISIDSKLFLIKDEFNGGEYLFNKAGTLLNSIDKIGSFSNSIEFGSCK